MTRKTLLSLPILLAFACGISAFAKETIGWAGLVPPLKLSYPKLEGDASLNNHLLSLQLVRNQRLKGRSSVGLDKIELKAMAALRAAGIDPEAFKKQLDDYYRERDANQSRLVEDLDGRHIEIAGYLLPTEFSGDRVAEFLLVPYDGACVHTPVPPPNQLIYVRPDEAFASEGLFMPVVVSGIIRTEMMTRSVGYSDGSNEVRSGYVMPAAEVRPYRK